MNDVLPPLLGAAKARLGASSSRRRQYVESEPCRTARAAFISYTSIWSFRDRLKGLGNATISKGATTQAGSTTTAQHTHTHTHTHTHKMRPLRGGLRIGCGPSWRRLLGETGKRWGRRTKLVLDTQNPYFQDLLPTLSEKLVFPENRLPA